LGSYRLSEAVACECGVNAAILLDNVAYWCERNERAGDARHLRIGRWWTYNGISAFARLYPWMSYDQARRALAALEAAGLLDRANLNDNPYDKTLWYTPTERGWELCRGRSGPAADMPHASGAPATSDGRWSQPDVATRPSLTKTDMNPSLNPDEGERAQTSAGHGYSLVASHSGTDLIWLVSLGGRVCGDLPGAYKNETREEAEGILAKAIKDKRV
jgi:hypothetical protein